MKIGKNKFDTERILTAMKQNYSLQLYSVRDITSDDFKGALEKVAKIGYAYVEPAGFFGNSAEDVKAMLAEYGLSISGTHSDINELRPDRIMETLAYHKTIANPCYIIPYADLSTLDKIEAFCNIVNYAQPILASEGIKLAFHNHSGEFQLMPWGSTIHTELEKRTNMFFEIDTFWAFNAGIDAVATMERLKNRLCAVHLKDGFKADPANDIKARGMSLGQGEAPVADIRRKAIALGVTMAVESEGLNPDGISEVARCMDYLRQLDSED